MKLKDHASRRRLQRLLSMKVRGKATVIAIPPLILTLIVQRRLVAGLAAGAVKG